VNITWNPVPELSNLCGSELVYVWWCRFVDIAVSFVISCPLCDVHINVKPHHLLQFKSPPKFSKIRASLAQDQNRAADYVELKYLLFHAPKKLIVVYNIMPCF